MFHKHKWPEKWDFELRDNVYEREDHIITNKEGFNVRRCTECDFTQERKAQ